MPVDLTNLETEALELRGKGIQVCHLGRGAEPLQAIEIHEQDDLTQLVMRNERQCLPSGALIALAVGHHAIDAPRVSEQALAKRQTRSQPQPMPKASNGKWNVRDAVRHRVPPQLRAVLVKL